MAKEQEREGSGVLVFGMGPGFVRTEMTEFQITSAEGRKWLPSSREAVEAGRDRSPEDCARTSVALVRAACPALNGNSIIVNPMRTAVGAFASIVISTFLPGIRDIMIGIPVDPIHRN